MRPVLRCDDALLRGYERLAAWADLLDRINVFPVADADTGTNLKISLAPLRRPAATPTIQRENLLRAATGNSGNIACAFLGELIEARRLDDLSERVPTGRDSARRAVADPQPGTMLTLFDALADAIADGTWQVERLDAAALINPMRTAVAATPAMLPDLQRAGVVDAGALGMFIFLEAYLAFLFETNGDLRPVTESFPTGLTIRAKWTAADPADEYCINGVIRSDAGVDAVAGQLVGYGSSLILTGQGEQIKVHAHTVDRDHLHRRLTALGPVIQWSEDPITVPTKAPDDAGSVHIMTDAAGSLTREDARQLGVTLLSSYLIVGDRVWPETLHDPAELYAAMANGARVTTAQASDFERGQSYLSATRRFDKTLYLCVGSVYTGNYASATRWLAEADSDRRMTVIDSGTASGRLGIAAMATARFARTGGSLTAVRDFAEKTLAASRELVFLDTLKYLAAGGRVSKTKGFFGDLLHLKPVISPQPDGAARVGMVRSQSEQVALAFKHLDRDLPADTAALILVEYTDNRPWVEAAVVPAIASRYPSADILVRPISLTSGAHMGPGTWGVAYLADGN